MSGILKATGPQGCTASFSNRDFHSCRFESIQALRGIAALFVILEHIRFLNCGAFGVDIFFCISGFMMMLSTHKHTGHFFGRRLIRILPLYYLMTLGTWVMLLLFPGLFEQTTANPAYLVKSLLFIPFDIDGGIIQPLMRIGWTVNCEMFFYLLFFISLRLSQKYRGLLCSGFLILPVLLNQLLPTAPAPLAFYGNPVMLEFILGILCYYGARLLYTRHQEQRLPKISAVLALLTAVLLFLALIVTKPSINILGIRRLLLWGLPGMLIVLCFFAAGLYIRFPACLVHLGDMSFSIYLIHYYPVMLLDRTVFDFSQPSPAALFGVFLTIPVCLLCSSVSYRLIEKWLTAKLKRLLK